MRFGERTKLFLRSCLGVGDEKRPFYLFLHLPKCAGSTINFHIQEKYSIKSLHLPTIATPILTGLNEVPWATRDWLDAYISHLPDVRRRSIRIVYGHLAYLGIHNLFRGEPRYFAFLRNPVDRVVSQYNWGFTENASIERVWGVRRQSGDIVPFREWLASSGRAKNLMVKCLSMAYSGTPSPGEWGREATYQDLQKSKQMLEQCYFVGLTENIVIFVISLMN